MKYKVGDKVRVKSLDWYNENKGEQDEVCLCKCAFVDEMTDYCGKECVITDVDKTGERYVIDIDNERWLWVEGFFEDIPKDINVYIYGVEDRGDEVIKMLEDCGGVNFNNFKGESNASMYYISKNGIVNRVENSFILSEDLKHGRTELKLPEKPKFKDGDIVICRAINTIAKIGSVDYIILVNDQWIKREFKKPLDGMADEDDFATVQEAEIYHKVVDLNIKNLEEPDYMKLTLVRNSEDGEWCPNVYFSFDYEENKHSMQCCDWKGCDMFVYAIPYEGNEHLLNKVK